MPHCIIEYSKDLENTVKPSVLIDVVHQGAVDSNLFDTDHIKTRALAYQNYNVGISNNAFIHVTVRLLAGRTAEQKAMLSECILSQIKSKPLSLVVVTVQIMDIDTESYSKAVMM